MAATSVSVSVALASTVPFYRLLAITAFIFRAAVFIGTQL